MKKSLSVSRQGTFDTGRAQVDKLGSIRRGEVELPIVDENSTKLQSDKSHSDSGLDSQPSADRSRSPNRSISPLGFTAAAEKKPDRRGKTHVDGSPSIAEEAESARDSKEKPDKGDLDSSRYADHNKLFPETEDRYVNADKYGSQTRRNKHETAGTRVHTVDKHRFEELGRANVQPVYHQNKHLGLNTHRTYKGRHEHLDTSGERKKSLQLSDSDKKQRKVSIAETFDESIVLSHDASSVSTKTTTDHNRTSVSVKSSPGQSVSEAADERGQPSGNDQGRSTKKSPPNKRNHVENDSDAAIISPVDTQDRAETSRHSDNSGQQQAKQNALARLKASKRDEQKILLDAKPDTRSSREVVSQRPSLHTQTAEAGDVERHLVAVSPKKQLHQTQEVGNPDKGSKPDSKHTNQKQKHHDKSTPQSQQTPRTTEKTHEEDNNHKPTPREQQTKRKATAPHSPEHKEEKPEANVAKKTRMQRTPALEASTAGLANSDTDNPGKLAVPRLSVEHKVPGEATHKTLTDRTEKSPANSQYKSEYLKTNIVTGKAWDQKTATSDAGKRSDQHKAATPTQNAGKNTETLKDNRSQSQLETVMALAGGRPHGGETLAGVTAERDQLLRNERTYQQRILQLEDEVKSVIQQSQELSTENKHLRAKVEAYDDKTYGGSLELKELRREKQELVGMVAKATTQKQEVDAENERLKSKLQEMEGKSKQWDAIYVENNKMKTKQAELERKVQDLEKEKNGLMTSLKTADSKQLDKLDSAQNENKKLQAELINMQTKNSLLETKAERLEVENKEATERLEQKRNELDELMRAMKTETAAEVELKEIHSALETAQTKISDYKVEIDEANRRFQNAEKEKDDAKSALKKKEIESKTMKANLDEKESQIGDLKRQADTAKRNTKKLEDELEDAKQVEKDAISMKARIRSLKNEIEDSLAANQKLKQERADAKLETDRLTRELATSNDSLTEAKRYIKKLEADKASREKVEEELQTHKKREQELERQLFDLNVRNDQLTQKTRELQEDKEDILKTRSNATEVENVNRKLQDENRKLRQMLVERNMELAHRQSERKSLVHRVDNLERKQNDADVKVQQLRGWVDNVLVEPTHHPHPPSQPLLTLPPVPAHGVPKVSQPGRSKKKRQQQQQQQNKLNRSWEDMKKMDDMNDSAQTTPSLPIVLDGKYAHTPLPGGTGPPGYYDMYKQKMKLIRDRRC